MNAKSIEKNLGEDSLRAGRQAAARRMEEDISQLVQALLTLKTEEEGLRFLRDICTPYEIKAIAERLEVARLLDAGELSYRDIYEKTGVSTTTVSRVARFLFHENHRGYRLVLDRLKA